MRFGCLFFAAVSCLCLPCFGQQEIIDQLDIVQAEAQAVRTKLRAGEITGALDALDQAIAQARAAAEALPPPSTETDLILAAGTVTDITSSMTVRRVIGRGGTIRFLDDNGPITFAYADWDGEMTVEVGTPTDPFCCPLTFVFRAIPLDASDTEELGRHFMAMGNSNVAIYGQPKTEVATLPPLPVGADTVPVPSDWKVGDVICVPDLRMLDLAIYNGQYWNYPRYQSWSNPRTSSQDKTYKIVSIVNGMATLDRGLENPVVPVMMDDAIIAEPYAVNGTRNIKFINEDPTIVKGHIMVMDDANWISKYVQFENFGRTTSELGSHIARYTFHGHHGRGVIITEGCSYVGDGVVKWGRVMHDTHGSLSRRDVAFGFFGAGFVDEDGVEVGNIYDHCEALVIKGIGNLSGNSIKEKDGHASIRGAEGAGFWLSSHSQTPGCRAANCNFGFANLGNGFAGVYGGRAYGYVDSHGRKHNLVGGLIDDVPYPGIAYQDVTALACNVGIEPWGTDTSIRSFGQPTIDGATIAACWTGIVAGRFSGIKLLKDAAIVQDPSRVNDKTRSDRYEYAPWVGSQGIFSTIAYNTSIHMDNVLFHGFQTGMIEFRYTATQNVRFDQCGYGWRPGRDVATPAGLVDPEVGFAYLNARFQSPIDVQLTGGTVEQYILPKWTNAEFPSRTEALHWLEWDEGSYKNITWDDAANSWKKVN